MRLLLGCFGSGRGRLGIVVLIRGMLAATLIAALVSACGGKIESDFTGGGAGDPGAVGGDSGDTGGTDSSGRNVDTGGSRADAAEVIFKRHRCAGLLKRHRVLAERLERASLA